MEKQAAINSREETQRYRAPNLLYKPIICTTSRTKFCQHKKQLRKNITLYVPALLFLLLILHNKDGNHLVIVSIVALCYVASFPCSRAWASPSLSHKSLGTRAMVRD